MLANIGRSKLEITGDWEWSRRELRCVENGGFHEVGVGFVDGEVDHILFQYAEDFVS